MGSYVKTTAGTDTCVVPTGATNVRKRCWGAGGGGAGGPTSSSGRNGGGGGEGGGYSEQTDNVTGTYDISVGSGGAGVTGNTLAGTGGDTSVSLSGTTKALAKGGKGASSRTGGSGTDNATNGTGSIKKNGGSGGNNAGSDHYGGGGGEAADDAANGNNGQDGDGITIGLGGSGGTTGGDGGNGGKEDDGVTPPGNGQNGSAPGGGGGGGGAPGAYPATTGGNGAVGKVEITWTDPPSGSTYNDSMTFAAGTIFTASPFQTIGLAFTYPASFALSELIIPAFPISTSLLAGSSLADGATITRAESLVAAVNALMSTSMSPSARSIAFSLGAAAAWSYEDRFSTTYPISTSLGVLVDSLNLLFRTYGDSLTMSASALVQFLTGYYYADSMTFGTSTTLSPIQHGFPLTATLGSGASLSTLNAFAKAIATTLAAGFGIDPEALPHMVMGVLLSSGQRVTPSHWNRVRAALSLAIGHAIAPQLGASWPIGTTLGTGAGLSATLRQAVAVGIRLSSAASQASAFIRSGANSVTLASGAAVLPTYYKTAVVSVSLGSSVGSQFSSGLSHLAGVTLGASTAIQELVRSAAALTTTLRSGHTVADLLQNLVAVSESLIVEVDETIGVVRVTGLGALLRAAGAVSPALNADSAEFDLGVVMAVVSQLNLDPRVAQAFQTALRSATSQSVYFDQTRVSGVTLPAAQQMNTGAGLVSTTSVDLVASLLSTILIDVAGPDNIYFAPDGIWTHATIKNEDFTIQE